MWCLKYPDRFTSFLLAKNYKPTWTQNHGFVSCVGIKRNFKLTSNLKQNSPQNSPEPETRGIGFSFPDPWGVTDCHSPIPWIPEEWKLPGNCSPRFLWHNTNYAHFWCILSDILALRRYFLCMKRPVWWAYGYKFNRHKYLKGSYCKKTTW